MKEIYIDSMNRCHVNNDGTRKSVKTDFFDEKCEAFIEGYSCEVKESGIVLYPRESYSELFSAQKQYEKDLADRADLEAAYNYLLTGGMRNE